ncbi:hypothetical protein UFOVP184_52 [uncultured Caudovirales phage]|uniref:Uncharacterized protein n=1 Tax=uncultured Caudovirales phage TaxID=2100421 RepID=A0A6J7WDB1_9CAUD|nr:hypothetical protein UFOVP184_52 [uncultured Caudovirales phage]
MAMNMNDSVKRAIASRARRGVGNTSAQPGPSPFVGPPSPAQSAAARPRPKAKRTMADTVQSAILSRAKRGVGSTEVIQKMRSRRGMV